MQALLSKRAKIFGSEVAQLLQRPKNVILLRGGRDSREAVTLCIMR